MPSKFAMTCPTDKEKFRGAVVGAAGIGAVHVRELLAAGALSVLVAGRCAQSAEKTARHLSANLGDQIIAAESVAALAASSPDVACICSPNELHLDHASALIEAGSHVLVEKPLFWNAALSPAENDAACRAAFASAEGRLAVNHPTAEFAAPFVAACGPVDAMRTFQFSYRTRGKYTGDLIAVDLLPHALSLLLALAASRDGRVCDIAVERGENTWRCAFEWADINCRFDFLQDPAAASSDLSFEIDRRRARRMQVSRPGGFAVMLDIDGLPGAVAMENPMTTTVKRAVAARKSGSTFICDEARTLAIIGHMVSLISA